VKNADGFSTGGLQLVAPQPLMLPDGLQQTFGWQAVSVAQNIGRGELRPPRGVEVFNGQKHFPNFLRRCPSKSSGRILFLNATNGGFAC